MLRFGKLFLSAAWDAFSDNENFPSAAIKARGAGETTCLSF
jgi:hypothetical protein